MSTRVARVVSFPASPEALLEYLVARTDETVARRVERSSVVAEGHVTQVEVETEPRRVERARLAVDRMLVGEPSPELVLVHAADAPGSDPLEPQPSLLAGDAGLFFLAASDVAPPPALRLAGGPRDFVSGGDAELAAAVEWYAALPHDADARRAALLAAVGDGNPRIARAAVRELAALGGPGVAEALRAAWDAADEDLRDRIELALFLLQGEDPAVPLLRSGDDAWLHGWGLDYSRGPDGERENVLYGPDPAETRGD